MMRKIILFIAAISVSPVVMAGTISAQLTMINGYFKAKISAPDDENIWMGNVDFDYLGSTPLHCENVGIGTGGEGAERFTSATYECQNQFKVHMKKTEKDEWADFSVFYQDKKQNSYKVKSDIPLAQYVASDYLSKRGQDDSLARAKRLSDETITLMQACMGIVQANQYAANASLMPDGSRQAISDRVYESIEPIYGKDAKIYADKMLAYYSENKDEASIVSRQNGSSVYTAQLCTQQPDKYIPDIGKLLWSGKVRK